MDGFGEEVGGGGWVDEGYESTIHLNHYISNIVRVFTKIVCYYLFKLEYT